MKILYVDGSFDWHYTEKTEENVVRGKIAISDGNSFKRIEKVAVGKVDGLQQYINIFELTAIARAIELASENHLTNDSLTIITDSQTAMFWARAKRIKNKDIKITEAHDNAFEYLLNSRIKFGGEVIFDYISRDKNPAGKLLEKELKDGKKPYDP